MSEEANQRTGGRASETISKRRRGLQRAAERGSPQTQQETAVGGSEAAETGGAAPGNGSRRGAKKASEKPIRITVDLPRDEHRALRVFAAQNGSDGMRVVRAALAVLEEDEEFAARVRERLEASA